MVIFLMGPTASGKTGLAMALFDRLPSEIISVDSALVYRGMDIGTAKPSRNELLKYPHHLIDIRDPAEQYSVADFCRDAEVKINHAIDRGVTPILVGGSMMYFKALLDGLASMPRTNQEIRDTILEEANEQGWPYMHQVLTKIDPEYAAQIHPNHSQRISRALEVYRASGKTMTQYRQQQADDKLSTQFVDRYNVVQIALLPQERSQLHRRIEERFNLMLDQGLIDEVTHLRNRGDLHVDLPSMRAVGYRQVWQHLNGEYDREKMIEKGIVATRQLAKRQLTWLRGWDSLNSINVNWNETQDTVKDNLEFIMNLLSTKSL